MEEQETRADAVSDVSSISYQQEMNHEEDHPNTMNVAATAAAVQPQQERLIATEAEIPRLKQRGLTMGAKLFKVQYDKARSEHRSRCEKGLLKQIVDTVEDELHLPSGTLCHRTIYKRALRNSVTGYHPCRVSPLAQLDTLLIEYCVTMELIDGTAIGKKQLMIHANSLIVHSKTLQRRMYDYKTTCGLQWDVNNMIGDGWYRNFVKKYESTIRQRVVAVSSNNNNNNNNINNMATTTTTTNIVFDNSPPTADL
jgi:hypothetical protein